MITAYLKPTNFCNVDCAHCYLPLDVRANKDKMSDEMLHKVMSFLKDMMKKYNHQQIFIIWHGGEPLVLPPSYFENAGKIIDEYFTKEQLIEGFQTSLIPYKSEFAPIIKARARGEVGSSMDFASRLIKGSPEEYQKLWMMKVELARKDGIFVIPGMVPSKEDCSNAKFIYKWFEDRDFWVWNIDRYTSIGQKLPNFSTNRDHAQFLIDLFDLVVDSIDKKGVAAFIKPIGAAIGGILFDQPGDRWGGTCQSDFIVINPDGKLNNCPDKDSFEESYGNIKLGLGSFESSPMRKKWIRIQQAGHRINDCYTCENSSWCKSGCPITGNACEIDGQTDECSGYKSFITHVRKFINQSEDHKLMMIKYMSYGFIPKEVIGDKDGSNSTMLNMQIQN